MKAKVILGAVAALLSSVAAQAATLENISGPVLVNHGKGFVPASGSVDLIPGDRVKLGPQAKARLVYSDGCGVDAPAGGLVTIGKHSPCSFKAQASSGDPLGGFIPSIGGLPPMVVGLGALGAIGLGVGLGVGLNGNGGNNNPFGKCIPGASGGFVCL